MTITAAAEISFPQAIRNAYALGQEDEALEPIVRVDGSGKAVGRISGGDSVVFYDVRGEREIQLTESLTEDTFARFPVNKDLRLNFVTLIEYARSLKVRVAFPPQEKLRNTLAEVLGRAAYPVIKISESEKAIHVGYFLNGRNEDLFPGEERVSVPSPQADSYAEVPEMAAGEVARELSDRLQRSTGGLIIVNLANVDVIGHIEDKNAVVRAVRCVDRVLGEIVESVRREKATLLVTSDHGTVEEWLYPDGTVNTGHTANPVPFILADFSEGNPAPVRLKKDGELADVAPSILELLEIPKPSEMTGQSLLLGRRKKGVPGKKVVLLILDGWGMREEARGNLIREAGTPVFDGLWGSFPGALLESSGEAVGMPPGAVGNSEAGHLHIGAGRRVLLDRVRIDKAVADGGFFENDELLRAAALARRNGRALHLMGIVSHYSSHGSISHLFALLKLAKARELDKVFVHAFIGRRGERPESGAIYVEKVEDMCRELGVGRVATVMGRFWALDREENWDRIEKAYRALVDGRGTRVCPGDRILE